MKRVRLIKRLGQKVGYGKPPDEHKFKPGQCGNPKGRPKGSRNLKALWNDLLKRKIWVVWDGVKQKVPLAQAVIMRIAQRALQGDIKQANFLLSVAESLEHSERHAATKKSRKNLSVQEMMDAYTENLKDMRIVMGMEMASDREPRIKKRFSP